MAVSVSKAGPYYSSGDISFSSLRNNFKEVGSGRIRASELRRNTSIGNINPVVPDASENNNISTSSNLALSQFRNSIKYYFITQTGTDINFDISAQPWNGNLNRNIRKWIYMNGTCGSNSIGATAASFNATAYNLTVDVSGGIYGAAGAGGNSSTISGGEGGTALSMRSSNGRNIVILLRDSANIYGGGGGGEKGATGANGSSGTCTDSYTAENCGSCPGCASGYVEGGCWSGGGCDRRQVCNWWGNCWWETSRWTRYRTCTRTYVVSGGAGGIGGDGGTGRGYNYGGSLAGAGGAAGGPNNGCGSTNGATGETGGSGGDWGSSGGNTSNSGNGGPSGRAISGSNYSVSGTINSSTIRGLYLP